MTCLIGDEPGNNFVCFVPSRLLLGITCCVYWTRAGSSGMAKALMLPVTSERLYCPPCSRPRPVPPGKRSLGALGARPELLTTTEEFSTPVPFPLPTKMVWPAIASADGYCP